MNLTELRKEKNIKMTDLAAQLGISQGHLSNIENGHRRVDENLLEKVAAILGESVDVVATATRSREADTMRLRSWMSTVRINGLPLAKAFTYYLQQSDKRAAILQDDGQLKQELKQFIVDNIAFSVLAEMTENKALIPNLKSHIAGTEADMKANTNHEHLTKIE